MMLRFLQQPLRVIQQTDGNDDDDVDKKLSLV